jgi:hypothetical protein
VLKCASELRIIQSLLDNNRDLAISLRNVLSTSATTKTTTTTTPPSTRTAPNQEEKKNPFSISDEDFNDEWFGGASAEPPTTTTPRVERDYPHPSGPVINLFVLLLLMTLVVDLFNAFSGWYFETKIFMKSLL